MRHLLKSDLWPEDYYNDELEVVFENIMLERDKLKGVNHYLDFIKKVKRKSDNDIRLKVMEAQQYLMVFAPDLAAEQSKQWGFNYKTVEELTKAISRRNLDKRIKAMRKEGIVESNISFDEMLVDLRLTLKNRTGQDISLNRDMTVSEFIAYENIIKRYKSNGKV